MKRRIRKLALLAERQYEHARSQAPAWERAVLEALPTALNIFEWPSSAKVRDGTLRLLL